MDIFIPDYVLYVLEKLEHAGYEAYIVGGSVRDAILGVTPKDYDVTTSATVSEMKDVFSCDRLIETGVLHGTLTVLSENKPVEVTTFRIDGDYDDHRHPNNVVFTKSLEEDLSRRDFTINAMAFNKRRGLVDLFGGCDDLKNKIIRTVGNPIKRFSEDALRILRGIRFASRLDFTIEDETFAAMHSKMHELNEISVERIYNELCGIVSGSADGILKNLTSCKNIIFQIIPELRAEDGCEQLTEYHVYDVWTHTVHTVAAVDNELDLRLTMLFHDIAKPSVKVFTNDMHTSFKTHEIYGAEMAASVLKRLKAPNKICDTVYKLIRHHEWFKNDSIDSYFVGKMLNLLGGIEMGEKLVKVFDADQAGKSVNAIEKNYPTIDKLWKELYNYKTTGKCYKINDLAVTGDDLMESGIKKGREVGGTLEILLDLVMRESLKNEKEELLLYVNNMNRKG